MYELAYKCADCNLPFTQLSQHRRKTGHRSQQMCECENCGHECERVFSQVDGSRMSMKCDNCQSMFVPSGPLYRNYVPKFKRCEAPARCEPDAVKYESKPDASDSLVTHSRWAELSFGESPIKCEPIELPIKCEPCEPPIIANRTLKHPYDEICDGQHDLLIYSVDPS